MRCILRNGELGITFELLFFTKLKLRNKLLSLVKILMLSNNTEVVKKPKGPWGKKDRPWP